MKQLFSVYPAGVAGAGLLLFRLSLALFIVAGPPASLSHPWWTVLGLSLVALFILVGFCTRVVALLCAVAGLAVLLTGETAAPISFIVQALAAAALAMIGPGAFSVDARLFGRSTITFPN
jgi:hypothetical protein